MEAEIPAPPIVNLIIDQTQNSILDIKNICRACLSAEENMIPLFSLNDCEVLANMFSITTSIKIEPEENLPQQVCESCQHEIIKSYNFKLKCSESDSFLRTFIAKDEKLENTSDLRNSDSTNIIDDTVNEEYIKKENDIELKNENDIELKIEEQDIEYLDDNILSDGDLYLSQNNDDCSTNDKNFEIKNEGDYKCLVQLIARVPGTDVTESNEYYKKIPNTKKNKKRKKQLECDVCFKTFLKMKTLNAHIQQHHSPKKEAEEHGPFPCGQCKESFNSEHDLQLHSAVHTNINNKWTCNQCNKEFTVKNGLRRHIKRHMEWKRHACGACGKAFAERCALRRHARVHTGELQEKKFTCDHCDKKFIDRSQLATHAARHTGELSHACAQCGKAFRSRRLLASHGRVHSDLKPYGCLYCSKRFRHESTLNTHHRTHTGEKPYVCSICGKTFIQHSNLTLHMRTHTGEKPYSCDLCDRKFSSGSTLNTHRRVHTGEKPYSCPICRKRFARTDIRTHMRQHSGERPFACRACNKSFASAARLRSHHLIHSGERAFKCGICSIAFKRKSHLVRHLKWHEASSKAKKTATTVLRAGPQAVRESVIVRKDDYGKLRASDPIATANRGAGVPVDEMSSEESQELILDDSDVKNEVVVVDEKPYIMDYQNEHTYMLT